MKTTRERRDHAGPPRPTRRAHAHSTRAHTQAQHHRAHTQPGHQTITASCRSPASRHRQMQRLGTRERACRSERGQTPLARARTHRPATSQHRVGTAERQRTDDRRRTLFCGRGKPYSIQSYGITPTSARDNIITMIPPRTFVNNLRQRKGAL